MQTRTRVLWWLIGLCLFIGAGISIALWMGSARALATPYLREFGAIVDVIAVLLWMLVISFSMAWTKKR